MPCQDPFPKSWGSIKNRRWLLDWDRPSLCLLCPELSLYLDIYLTSAMCKRERVSSSFVELNETDPCFPHYCPCSCSSHCKFLTAACLQHWGSPWCFYCSTFEIRHFQNSSLSLGLWLSAKSRNIPVVYDLNFMDFSPIFFIAIHCSLRFLNTISNWPGSIDVVWL